MPATPRVYSAITCNFCHRVEIALHAKGVAFETVTIDLVKRPEAFRGMASGGSVPLLEFEGHQIHPSGVINEFVEERWPEPPLLPSDPAARAEARTFIDWWNDAPCPAYERRLMNVRPERDEVLTKNLEAGLRECERKLAARDYDGGYWHGATIGLVDATAAPMFVRFAGLRHFHGIDIPEDCGRVRAWHDRLMADPHVAATRPDETELLDTYDYYRRVLTKAAEAGIDVPVAKGD